MNDCVVPMILTGQTDRRSAIYSDRPRWVLASDILARNMHVGVVRYGEAYVSFGFCSSPQPDPPDIGTVDSVEPFMRVCSPRPSPLIIPSKRRNHAHSSSK